MDCATACPAKVGISGSIPTPDDDEVAGHADTIGGHDRLHAVVSFKPSDLILAAQLDAVLAVDRAERCADLVAQHPFERRLLGKYGGHPNPELRQGGGHLATDEPHPHDHSVADSRLLRA